MASSDNQNRSVIWPPPAPDRTQEWQQQHQHYGQSYGQQQERARLKLTPEEMAVLQSCSRESFWYRCVPLALGAIVATQTLTNRGILKPNPRYGSLFKNMAVGMVAYFIGKLSYQGECRRKIMMLENSPLADAMRKGKKGRDLFQEMVIPPSGGGEVASPGPSAKFAGQSTPAGSHLDIDTESRKYTELDDGLRPTLDTMTPKSSDASQNPNFTSYADLRAQNRIDYERKMSSIQGPGSQTRQPPNSPSFGERPLPPPPPSSDMYSSGLGMGSTNESSSSQRRNKYGDVLE